MLAGTFRVRRVLRCGSDVEDFAQEPHGVLGVFDRVALGARVAIDLVVVAALVRLVAEEVDGGVVDAALLGLALEVTQTVRLVPAVGEDVKGDLAANGKAIRRARGP